MSNPAFIFQALFWAVVVIVCAFPFIGPWSILLVLLAGLGGFAAHVNGQNKGPQG